MTREDWISLGWYLVGVSSGATIALLIISYQLGLKQ